MNSGPDEKEILKGMKHRCDTGCMRHCCVCLILVWAAAAAAGSPKKAAENKEGTLSQRNWFAALTCRGSGSGAGLPPGGPGTCGPRKRPFNLPNMSAELTVPLRSHLWRHDVQKVLRPNDPRTFTAFSTTNTLPPPPQ